MYDIGVLKIRNIKSKSEHESNGNQGFLPRAPELYDGWILMACQLVWDWMLRSHWIAFKLTFFVDVSLKVFFYTVLSNMNNSLTDLNKIAILMIRCCYPSKFLLCHLTPYMYIYIYIYIYIYMSKSILG